MASSVSQSSLLESFASKTRVGPGPTTQSDVLIKFSDGNYPNGKSDLATVFIDNKALIITIPHFLLSTRVKAYLEGGICDIYDMSFVGIKKGYKASLCDFIKDGYSIILEYKKKKHILIYNG